MRPSFKIMITLSIILIIPSIIYYRNVKEKKIEKFTTRSSCGYSSSAHEIIHGRKYSFQERVFWANRSMPTQKLYMDYDYTKADLKNFPSASPDEYTYFKQHGPKHYYWKSNQPSKVTWS